MAIQVKHILEVLEGVAPQRLAETWDNPGLQVGGLEDPVRRILISLDPTMESVREATRREAHLLITHHPLIFKSITSIEPSTYPGDVLYEAIQNGMAMVAAHTNLDAAKGGLNDLLAGLLGLEDIFVLQETADPGLEAGLGRVGALPNPLALAEFVHQVKRTFNAPTVGVVGSPNRTIRSVAVVGGSGGSLIAAAAQKRADVLITGDIGHHDALAACTLGMAVIDAGHFLTEKTAMTEFRDTLTFRLEAAGLEGVEVEVYHEEKPPMRYE